MRFKVFKYNGDWYAQREHSQDVELFTEWRDAVAYANWRLRQ